MSYGKEKERDMIRSILPSSRRKGARDDRAYAHRRHRSTVKHALRQHKGDLDYLSDTADCAVDEAYSKIHDADFKRSEAIKSVMWDRRDGDKLSPMLRWAPHQVGHLRLEDRLSYMRGRLPDNTVGRHAVGHLKYEEDFYVPEEDGRFIWWRPRSRSQIAREREERYLKAVKNLEHVCEKANRLARFNDVVSETIVIEIAFPMYSERFQRTRIVRDVSRYDVPVLDGVLDIPDYIEKVAEMGYRHNVEIKRRMNSVFSEFGLDKI